jgi:hypothetical protein
MDMVDFGPFQVQLSFPSVAGWAWKLAAAFRTLMAKPATLVTFRLPQSPAVICSVVRVLAIQARNAVQLPRALFIIIVARSFRV